MKFNEINRKVNIGQTMSWFDGYALHKQNVLDLYSRQNTAVKACKQTISVDRDCARHFKFV
jgi:hypothetical protein